MRTTSAVVLLMAVVGTTRLAWAQREPTTQTTIGIFYQPKTVSLWREGDRG